MNDNERAPRANKGAQTGKNLVASTDSTRGKQTLGWGGFQVITYTTWNGTGDAPVLCRTFGSSVIGLQCTPWPACSIRNIDVRSWIYSTPLFLVLCFAWLTCSLSTARIYCLALFCVVAFPRGPARRRVTGACIVILCHPIVPV